MGWKWCSGLKDEDWLHLFTYSTSPWGGQICTGCLKDEYKINLFDALPIMSCTKVNLPLAFSQCCCFSPTLGQHTLERGSWQIQPPLTTCGCASTQRENTREKMAGCSSRGTHLPAGAQRARPHRLEAITCVYPAPHTAQQGAAHGQLLLLSVKGGSWGRTW